MGADSHGAETRLHVGHELALDENHVARNQGNDGNDDNTADDFHPPGLEESENGLDRGIHQLAVDLPENDVEGADDGDYVGDEMSTDHFVEGLKIDEGRGANADAIGLRGAIADDVVAEDTLGGLDGVIDLAGGRLEDFAYLAEDRSLGNSFDGLQADQAGLAHLFHANHVPVVSVAVGADGNFELILVVGRVGLSLAQVPLHAASAKKGTGGAESDAVGGTEHADVARAANPDTVAGQEIDIVLDAALEILAEALDVLLESLVCLVLQTANAESVRGEARATILFEDFEDFFALAEAVEERGESADVQSMSAEPNQVAGNALQFRKDGANDPGAWRRFGIEEFFDSLAIAQAIADRRDIIHAIDIRSKLLISAVLGDFFDAAVEIANDALSAANAFSVEFQLYAQHAVGRGMLRAHVDDKFVGAEKRVVVLRRVVLQSVSHVRKPYCPLSIPRFSRTQAVSCRRMS